MNQTQHLAEQHWSYVESVLKAHGIEKSKIEIAQFHYQSAFIHGYKHGIESLKDNQEPILWPEPITP